MRRQLIQTFMVVFLTTGLLLALESRATASTDALFAGDRANVHTEAWASANNPEIPLPCKTDHSADAGYHTPLATGEAQASPAQARRFHFARAPPAL